MHIENKILFMEFKALHGVYAQTPLCGLCYKAFMKS